jgi:Uma2 family endonuclease
MTFAPTTAHQRLVLSLATVIKSVLRGHPCTAYIAPTHVILSETNVVQPDVFVVCDPAKVTPAGIRGAPDLVVEILSPSTGLKDRRAKRALYERFGVREYLLVDPDAKIVERYAIGAEGAYGRADVFAPTETLPLVSLAPLSLPLAEVFEVEAPSVPA